MKILSLVQDILKITAHSFKSILTWKFSKEETIKELYEFGVRSFGIVLICVTFMGVIIILEYSYHMKIVIGNDDMIPGFAMILLTRELAPIVTALLLTSKMGASIAAELGAMKNTEQLDAYRLLGLSAIDIFVAPRVIASALATTALAIISLFIAMVGAWIAATTVLTFTTGTFFFSLFTFLEFGDFILMISKALFFGACIPVISSALGFRCRFGAEGVGEATTDAVVACSIWIIISDFFFTSGYAQFQ